MTRSISKYLVSVLFLMTIFGFGIWSLLDNDDEKSEMEGRTLQQKPVFNIEELLSGEYFSSYEDYYSDQFPLRTNWIETNLYTTNKLFGMKVYKEVFITNGDYLVSVVNPVDAEQSIVDVSKKIDHLAYDLKRENVPLYFALVPNKSTMMENCLPDYIESKPNELTDKLVGEISSDIIVLDLRSAIQQHLGESNMYFYTDHHWKPKAAFYAYAEIINRMNIDVSELGKPSDISDYTWVESNVSFYGSEARKVGRYNVSSPDTVTIVEKKQKEKPLKIRYKGTNNQPLFDENFLTNDEIYTNRYKYYFSGDVPEGIIRNPNIKNGCKLLIIKDSYANAMIPFFPTNFEEVRIMDRRHYDQVSVREYVKENDIDIVLLVHNINSLLTTPSLTQYK